MARLLCACIRIISSRFDLLRLACPSGCSIGCNHRGGRHFVELVASSTSGLYTLSVNKVGDLPIPLASFRQRRIVAEIEKQLTRLEAGVAALRRVQANLNATAPPSSKPPAKAASSPPKAKLAKTGKHKSTFELAKPSSPASSPKRRKNWQESSPIHGASTSRSGRSRQPPGWMELVIIGATICAHHRRHTQDPQLPAIGGSLSLRKGHCWVQTVLRRMQIHSESEHAELSGRCAAHRGNVLITKSGTIGRVAVVETDREFSLFESVANVPVTPPLNAKFVAFAAYFSIGGVFGAANQRALPFGTFTWKTCVASQSPFRPSRADAHRGRSGAAVERRGGVGSGGGRQPPARHAPPTVHPPEGIHGRTRMSPLVPKSPKARGPILSSTRPKNGRTRLQVQFQGETAWLSQAQMAELFQTTIPNVSMHIRNVFAEGELRADSVVKESLTTATDGKNYATKFYNLDVIISVRLPREIPSRYTVSHLGHAAVAGVHREGLCDGRRAAKAAWRRQLLRRATGAKSVTSGHRKRSSGARCLRSTRPASTTTPPPRRRRSFFAPCRTRCIGRRTGKRRRK